MDATVLHRETLLLICIHIEVSGILPLVHHIYLKEPIKGNKPEREKIFGFSSSPWLSRRTPSTSHPKLNLGRGSPGTGVDRTRVHAWVDRTGVHAWALRGL